MAVGVLRWIEQRRHANERRRQTVARDVIPLGIVEPFGESQDDGDVIRQLRPAIIPRAFVRRDEARHQNRAFETLFTEEVNTQVRRTRGVQVVRARERLLQELRREFFRLGNERIERCNRIDVAGIQRRCDIAGNLRRRAGECDVE